MWRHISAPAHFFKKVRHTFGDPLVYFEMAVSRFWFFQWFLTYIRWSVKTWNSIKMCRATLRIKIFDKYYNYHVGNFITFPMIYGFVYVALIANTPQRNNGDVRRMCIGTLTARCTLLENTQAFLNNVIYFKTTFANPIKLHIALILIIQRSHW